MSTIVAEIYDAFRAAKVPDDVARAAAAAVLGNSTADLVTKADLETALHQQTRWLIATMFALAAIVVAIIIKL